MKRFYFLPITVYFLLVFSCGQKQATAIPSDVLPKEKMAQVMTDIHIAEAEKDLSGPPDLPAPQASPVSKATINFQKIFEKHKITKEQYDKSLNFYIEHPELLDKVYEDVLNELSKMQGEAGKAKS